MTDPTPGTDPDLYARRRASALTDAWIVADLVGNATKGSKRIPVTMLRLLASTVIDQAAQITGLESLRDRDQLLDRPPLILDDFEELPPKTIVIDADGDAYQNLGEGWWYSIGPEVYIEPGHMTHPVRVLRLGVTS